MSSNTTKRMRIAIVILIPLSALLLFTVLYYFLDPFSRSAISDERYRVLATLDALAVDDNHAGLPADDADWVEVSLPIHWRNQFPDASAVWYRVQLGGAELSRLIDPDSTTEDSLLGIYLWRLNQTADVWLNGLRIGSGGSSTEPMARHWNSPLYFSIPASLPGQQNEILIKHFAQHSWGSMEPIVVGDDGVLRPIFEQRYFIQHDIALGLFVFVFFSGTFSFMVWLNRRQSVEYFWYAVASAGLSFYCANQFLRYLPINSDTWRWLSNVTTDLWAGALLIFMFRILQLSRPKVERLIYGYLLCGVPLYFFASFFQVFDINIYFHIGALLIGLYAFYTTVQEYLRTGNRQPAFYASIIALIMVAGSHDTLMQAVVNNGWFGVTPIEFRHHFNFVHFTAPIMFLVIAADLTKRFVETMNTADRVNEELEERVKETRQKLADNYQAIEQVLVEQSAAEERERIYRDLHDDVGSKLLSLYYRLDNEPDSTLAKSALEDLRDIVSRKTLDGCSLSEAVQQWEQEAHERLDGGGVTLRWQCDLDSTEVMLSDLQHTQLRRMLREVFSNAILHNKALKVIEVRISYSEGYLNIAVANDGVAKAVTSWRPGRGISNLRIRARDLQGKFDLTDQENGWVEARWKVPLQEAREQ